jgi:hypothetical protein
VWPSNADQAWWQVLKERQHGVPLQLTADEAVEDGKINTVDELTAIASHYLDEAIAIARLLRAL